ncbi:unnamed protein product [Ixodes persulcatus]
MLRSLSLLVLGAGLALCLDLESLQRTSHFPVPTTSMHRKRAESPEDLQDMGDKERLYYQLLSSRMARLLPSLLGEADLGPDGEEDLDDGQDESAGGVPDQEADEVMMYLPKRRVVHQSRSMQGAEASSKIEVEDRIREIDAKRWARRVLSYIQMRSVDTKWRNQTRKMRSLYVGNSKEEDKKIKVKKRVKKTERKIRKAGMQTRSAWVMYTDRLRRTLLRSSSSTILWELLVVRGEDGSKKEQKKKRTYTLINRRGGDGVSDSSKAESDEDKFKKWLLDEYYRTMALSFASMRKKRMAIHQDTLDLRKMKRDEQQADDQFQAVEEKLRGIEDAMIGEALELVRDGAGDESDLRAINAGVASRLDAAYDLESVRQSLGHLEATLDTMHRREDDDDAGQPEDVDDGPQGSWAQLVDKEAHSLIPPKKRQEEEVLTEPGCPALQVLSSGCAPLEDLTAFDASLETEVLSACSWHQVCYTCGSFFGLSSDDCDEGLGVANPQLARLVLDYLLRRQVFFKRSTPALCSTSCVSDFLLNH